MPRLLHGAAITLEAYQEAFDALVKCSKSVPLVFAAAQPIDLQDFDFLFPQLQQNSSNLLPESRATRDNLVELGKAMQGAKDDTNDGGDSNIPAAYTYFGQFVDHDVTLETVSADLPKLLSPDLVPLSLNEIQEKIRNIRTATLDLDSVYGLPAPRDPHHPEKLLVGTVTSLHGQSKPTLRPPGKGDNNDLPREPRNQDPTRDRAALTGDPRNDENLIIAQLHVAFLRAHNALVDQGRTFNEARVILRQHYQYIVLHDFLKRIADPHIVDYILEHGNRVYNALGKRFYLPLEFTVAAYRLGHSMVRSVYDFNLNFNKSGEPGVPPATLDLLFTFSALSGQLGFGDGTDTLPDNWIIEWENFVEDAGRPFNKARSIDTSIVEPLFSLKDVQGRPEPGDGARLSVRNLLRGYLLRMPTGQAVARELQRKLKGGYEIPVLSAQQIIGGAKSAKEIEVLQKSGFLDRTPLWYYTLVEAAVYGKGNHLGPVGSTLVAEVLIGLARRSEDSILSYPGWAPSLPCAKSGHFTLSDLLRFAGVLSPVSSAAHVGAGV